MSRFILFQTRGYGRPWKPKKVIDPRVETEPVAVRSRGHLPGVPASLVSWCLHGGGGHDSGAAIKGGNGGDRPPPKRARKIFSNIRENKSSDSRISLIPFVSSAVYVELPFRRFSGHFDHLNRSTASH